MVFEISKLLNKIQQIFKSNSIVYCRLRDDLRLNNIFIAINEQHYIEINGVNDQCDDIRIYRNTNISKNILTPLGLNQFANFTDEHNFSTELAHIQLNLYEGNMTDLISFLDMVIESILLKII